MILAGTPQARAPEAEQLIRATARNRSLLIDSRQSRSSVARSINAGLVILGMVTKLGRGKPSA